MSKTPELLSEPNGSGLSTHKTDPGMNARQSVHDHEGTDTLFSGYHMKDPQHNLLGAGASALASAAEEMHIAQSLDADSGHLLDPLEKVRRLIPDERPDLGQHSKMLLPQRGTVGNGSAEADKTPTPIIKLPSAGEMSEENPQRLLEQMMPTKLPHTAVVIPSSQRWRRHTI